MQGSPARLSDLPPPGAPVVLAEVRCRRCGTHGATIIALGQTRFRAVELAWCSIEHAKLDGWPWLLAERRRSAGGARSPPPAPSVMFRS